MWRSVLLIFFTVIFSTALKSQSRENHYRINFYTVTAQSKADMESVLYKITGASSINYESGDSAFLLSTARLLDKQVISGKLLKHYYPVRSITHLEADADPFPVMRNSGNKDADALQYEKEKQAWVKRYPNEYQKMIDKK